MDTKKISKIGFLISLVVTLLILAMDYFRNSVCCINDIKEILSILFYFSTAFIPIFLLLIFTHQKIFRTWMKFTIGYFVFASVLLIAEIIDGGGDSIGISGLFDIQLISIALAILFFIISILVIGIKFLTLPPKKK